MALQPTAVYKHIGGYTDFHEFRAAWARHLGFDLNVMEGFGGSQPWDRQPIQSFFRGPDTERIISWRDAEKILQHARKDAPELPDFRHQFRVLIEACSQAVNHKTTLVFL